MTNSIPAGPGVRLSLDERTGPGCFHNFGKDEMQRLPELLLFHEDGRKICGLCQVERYLQAICKRAYEIAAVGQAVAHIHLAIFVRQPPLRGRHQIQQCVQASVRSGHLPILCDEPSGAGFPATAILPSFSTSEARSTISET